MNVNRITLIGRVTRDLELKATTNGLSVVKFGLATNYTYKNKDGEKIENTTFHNIVAFGKVADVLNQYVVKGQELYVAGRQENKTYEKKDGTKGYSSEVMLEDFQFGAKAKGTTKSGDEGVDEQFEESANQDTGATEDEVNPEDIPF